MIFIDTIASYIPQNLESNFLKKSKFDINDHFIIDKLGVESVSRKAVSEDTSEMCVKAAESLALKTGFPLTDVDCLTVCTQNPEKKGIPHTSAIVHGKLDIQEECACFDISLGCSGFVYSLSLLKSFMAANRFKKGLLFTADPYSKILDPDDKNTELLFGDAATVTLLREINEKATGWIPEEFLFSTKGSGGDALHNDGEKLFMNGRKIFNFSLKEVPPQIEKLLYSRKLNYNDIDLFLFHQGSKYLVDQLAKRMKLPREKVPIDLKTHGNTVSSSIPLLFEKYIHEEDIQTILMSGFGVGLSWASCLVRKYS